jgi:formyltetrahydrofolate synthetase
VVAAVEAGDTSEVSSLYDAALPLDEKIRRVATEVYGAAGVAIGSEAKRKLDRYTRQGFGHLPICMAKTQSSLSDNPKAFGGTQWLDPDSNRYPSLGRGRVCGCVSLAQ